MADFSARISAQLDLSQFNAQMNRATAPRNVPISLNTQAINRQIDAIEARLRGLQRQFNNLGGGGGNGGGGGGNVPPQLAAYREMLDIARQINRTRVQISGLDVSRYQAQYQELNNQLNNLMATFNQLRTNNANVLTANQFDNLDRVLMSVENRIASITANMQDRSALQDYASEFQRLEQVVRRMDSLQLKIGNAGANAQEIAALQNELTSLTAEYNTLRSALQYVPSLDFTNVDRQLDLTRTKIEELNAKRVGEITLKINSGEVERSISKVNADYEKLRVTGHASLGQINTDIVQLQALQHTLATTTDPQILISSYQQYEAILKRVQNSLGTVAAESKAAASSLQISQLDNRIAKWLQDNSKASRDFGGSIAQLRNELAALQNSNHATAGDLALIEQQFNRVKTEAEAAGQVGASTGSLFQKAFSSVARYFSATVLISKAIGTIKQMAQNVLDVDTALTGLYRVTNLSSNEYDSLFDRMTASAKKYGATLTDIIDSTTTWVKLGFDANVAQQLGNITMMYQHVTDLDTETAVKNLVTAYKGFQDQLLALTNGDSAAAVEYVADIFDKLGNEFAVNAAQVGQGLVNSASALSVAGNSIQQSAAMLTGITEVTQDAAKAGKMNARTYRNVWCNILHGFKVNRLKTRDGQDREFCLCKFRVC